MAEFLNKDKAYAEIVEVVSKAENKVVLISPYIKIPVDLLERLKYMDSKGVTITVVCREKDLKAEVQNELKELKNLDLRFDENLHAKCFYNEHSMVITSLNLHEHSQLHNREMGILLNSKEDFSVFKEALSEAEYIASRAKREAKLSVASRNQGNVRRARTASTAKNRGYCIRCGESIALDLSAPYCPNCYRIWNRYKDDEYEEEYCHFCGKPNERTTKSRPLCHPCFIKILK